jgi:hypothetical protein
MRPSRSQESFGPRLTAGPNSEVELIRRQLNDRREASTVTTILGYISRNLCSRGSSTYRKTGRSSAVGAPKALLQSGHPDPVAKAKIADLRDKFRGAFTGWLEIAEAA